MPEADKIQRSDWVSAWAASNSFASDNPIQEEDAHDELLDPEEERSSSGQRRRLPPTPQHRQPNGYHTHQNKFGAEGEEDDTNDYLKDTISLMTAMEARISSTSADETVRSAKNSPKKEPLGSPSMASHNTPTKRRPKTAELRKSANNNAAAKAKEAKEKAAQQWQRRKNYDPLKSMAKAKLTSKVGDQYTDESSDVDSASASGCSFSHKSVSGGSVTNPRLAIIRSDGGRHSLRQSHKDDHQPQSLGYSSGSRYQPRPPFRTNVTAQNGGRSTSSLSSREAEFQAWKRRKNYNPMRSANSSTSGTSSAKASTKSSPSKTVVSKTNSVNTSVDHEAMTSSGMLQKRSASFHYPDGTSRITHSVYSSEEDFNDEDDEDEEPRLYEVNEDELFLAYDSGGIVPPRRPRRTPPPSRDRSGAGSTSSTQSGSKLEALDNLVISTIFSVSTKLCLLSGKLVKSLQERTSDKEEETMLQTLLYVLDDIDPPVSPSKKTSRELAGTLRNLKKVEQALQTLERSETDL